MGKICVVLDSEERGVLSVKGPLPVLGELVRALGGRKAGKSDSLVEALDDRHSGGSEASTRTVRSQGGGQ